MSFYYVNSREMITSGMTKILVIVD